MRPNHSLLTFRRSESGLSRHGGCLLLWRKLVLSLLLLPSLTALHGQDIVGQWQGTVQTAVPFRVVLKVLKNNNQPRAFIIWVDQSSEYFPVTSLSDPNGEVKFSNYMNYASFDGKMSSDRNQITGTWTRGVESMKLDLHRATPEESWLTKSAIRMITVAPNVSLEVVDWGGNGPPLIFLAGLGNTAHIFDTFAPKFLPEYHVSGITRRGYGVSSSPVPDPVNYRSDQLGDDVLRVIDSLGLKKPVLVGHSIAGEELSSIGSRYPKRIAGLIYLDAGYPYALYSADRGDTRLDAKEVQKQLGEYLSASPGADRKRIIADLLSQLSLLQKGLEIDQKHDELMPDRPSERFDAPIAEAIHDGERKYTDLGVPILAIFANPHNPTNYFPQLPQGKIAELSALDQARTGAQVKAFENLKSAKVVVLPNADHYVFSSNKQDVERTMKDFLNTLVELKNQ
jgi:non-heme chloroperoxidase